MLYDSYTILGRVDCSAIILDIRISTKHSINRHGILTQNKINQSLNYQQTKFDSKQAELGQKRRGKSHLL